MMRCSRRSCILGLLGLGSVGLWPRSGRGQAHPHGPAAGPAPVPPSPFQPLERRTLAAACERILPGAVEAGVPEYLDLWMSREPFSRFLQPAFARAAVLMDAEARAQGGQTFAALPSEAQDAVLRRFQTGELPARGFNAKGFFEHLVRLTLEGFLGDPRYGGNRGEVGWKLIGHRPCWWSPRRIDSLSRRGKALPY